MFSVTLDPTLLFENGKAASFVGANGYWNVGNGASWRWMTDARYMEVDCFMTGAFAVGISSYRLGVRITAGATKRDYWYTVPPTAGAYTAKFWLPPGLSKTIELHVPAQDAPSAGAAPQGVYPITCRFDQSVVAISPSLQSAHLVVYGDSVASGGLAIDPTLLGYCGLMKKGAGFGGYNGSLTQVSWGFRMLHDDCLNGAAQTAFATFLLSLSPTKILIAIGSNDYAVPQWTLAAFTTAYGGLLDQIIAQNGTVPIVCFSPIIRGNPADVANANGDTMAAYRTAISNAVAARPTRCTYLDGQPICVLTDLVDNVHPSTSGNSDKMLPAVLAAV